MKWRYWIVVAAFGVLWISDACTPQVYDVAKVAGQSLGDRIESLGTRAQKAPR